MAAAARSVGYGIVPLDLIFLRAGAPCSICAPRADHGPHAMPAARRAAAPEASGRTPTYSISDLAREFALTTRAIRFYEDCGLVAPSRRGRQRVYGDRERVRIKLILRGKRLGLALAEIGELLDMYEIGRNERAQLSRFLTLLAERRAMLLQQKEDIDIVLAEIGGIERECRRRLKEAAPGSD
jgi:DNA-binding transcriptional MerR regulator